MNDDNINDILIESKVRRIINDIIKADDINISQSLIYEDADDYELNSISFIMLIIKIEDEFEIEIPDEYLQIEYFDTINNIVELIKKCDEVNNKKR